MTARLKQTRKKRGHVSAGHGRIGKARKHPGGHGNAGTQHHQRINMDKYHPGYHGKVGMRHFCFRKNAYVCPRINVEKLWSLMPEEQYKKFKAASSETSAPIIDCIKYGYFKVLGKGQMPSIPCIVKAKYFSREAELKINAAGGVCVLSC